MLFKSHLAVLVLGLCELHLIGSVNNDKIALIDTNNKDKTAHDQTIQDKTALDIQPTSITRLTSKDKSEAPTTIYPTSNNKDKTVSATHSTRNDKDKTAFTSNDKDNTIITTHPTSNHKDKTVFITQPNTDKAPSTIKLPKSSTLKGDTTSHSGGLAATIPSMFTIASLICVLLL